MSQSRVFRMLAVAAFLLATSLASAKTLNTAMNGLDSSSCGDPKTPCRSISQAIVNAQPNDTVLVGPGHYGDVNGDGMFSGSGEEGQAGGCGCVVKIDEHIVVKSRDGAAATVIDAAATVLNPVALEPGSDGATLGGPQNGFTLRNSQVDGVFVDSAVTNAHILGNLAERNGGAGFQILGSGVSLSGDRAVGNGTSGFVIRNSGALATNDTATGNRLGFTTIVGALDCERCIASSNQFNGFFVQDGALTIRSSAVVGNGADGVTYAAGSAGHVTGSTLMGNGRAAPGQHCGVSNTSGTGVDATKNYWGAANGPGGTDPADASCAGGPVSTISTTPFKTSEFKLSPKPLR